MRDAIRNAEVGDDVLDGDPTTRRLEETVARLFGSEVALFFPSGTMANQCAIGAQTRPGDEILVDAESHIMQMEMAGVAANLGVQIRPVQSSSGPMTSENLLQTIRPPSKSWPRAALVSIENTHSYGGGMITPQRELLAIRAIADAEGMALHLDGARLWNVACATGISLAELAAPADTVMVSFSKGLGAPVGAALAGNRDLIERAGVVRKRLGGGMRQSGILAAAALYGIENNMDRLREDHENARALADILARGGHCRVVPPDTNIVMVDLSPGTDAAELEERCLSRGVRIAAWNRTRVRLVTHLDLTRDEVCRAGLIVREELGPRV
jgi:threonine aldolase